MHSGASPAGGNAPRFSFLPPPRFFSCPHGIFLGGRSWCFWAEKTLKFAISARKSLRISAKTFFFSEIACFRSENLCFGQKKPSHFGENLFAPLILILPPPPDLAKLATPLYALMYVLSFLQSTNCCL